MSEVDEEVETDNEVETETDDMNSILNSVKKMIGPACDYDFFDTDLIIHINSVFSILTQLGVGPEEGFSIQDKTAVWTDFLPDGQQLEFVKSYMYLKVRLLFDPPTAGSVMESTTNLTNELEWRILVAADTYEVESEEGE